MKIDYSQRKHESPFDDDPAENESPRSVDSLVTETPPPIISQPKNYVAYSTSEQAQFRIFIGAGFLIAAFPAAYWANYTFKEYQNNAAVLERWREHPEEIRAGLKPADQIYSQSTTVQNKLLEASLSGAGSLFCLIIAAFLFARARKIFRRIKAEKFNYESIDPQTIRKPKTPIKVRATVFQDVLLGFLILSFGGLNLLLLANSISQPRNLIISLPSLSLLFVICFLIYRAKKKSVRSFSEAGITRGDLRMILWKDFRGVTFRTATNKYAQKYIWRIELAFADGGEAWIIPQRVKNFDEVYTFVDTLPPAVLKSSPA